MIYPPAPASAKQSRTKGRGRKSKPPPVQWNQKKIQDGVVLVDDSQLAKLVKKEPLEKYYEIDPNPIATGLFASVRRCRSTTSGEQFAAKFSSRVRYGEDCSAEIYHEIMLLSICSSSRIVRLHDAFETPSEIILVLEYAPGGDLQTIIDDNMVPFEADVVKFVRQLVEGLAYIHERKVAHLDIKPQNLVMMGAFPDCDIKLCDFEISRVILEGAEIREILGTPDYVAPEILHYEPISTAADMWSLGVTAYVLLTGFSPFGGETDQETFCNISRAQLDFPDELFEDVSKEAQDFISRLLVRQPSARPTARECLRHPWISRAAFGAPPLLRHASAPLTNIPDPKTVHGESSGRTTSESNKTNHRGNANGKQNLRKYLSKSREALFERVAGSNLRKTLSKSRDRLYESQMSLNKSRDRLLEMSRSREKLYGLRSMSKSHEVLSICAGTEASVRGWGVCPIENDKSPHFTIFQRPSDIRASETDLLFKSSNLGSGSNKIPGPLERSATTISTESVCRFNQQYPHLARSKTLSESLDESIARSISLALLKSSQESFSLLDVSKDSSNDDKQTFSNDKKSETTSATTNLHNNFHQDEERHDEALNKKNGMIDLHKLLDMDGSIKECNNDSPTIEPMSLSQIESNTQKVLDNIENDLRNINTIIREEKALNDWKMMQSMAEENDHTEQQPVNMLTTGCEKEDRKTRNCIETIDEEDEEEDDEPRYTVQQLISAFNRHEKVVSETVLSPPVKTGDETPFKLPLGTNTLRLFIPHTEGDSKESSPQPEDTSGDHEITYESNEANDIITSCSGDMVSSIQESQIESEEMNRNNDMCLNTEASRDDYDVTINAKNKDNSSSSTLCQLIIEPAQLTSRESSPEKETLKSDISSNSATNLNVSRPASFLRSGSISSEASCCDSPASDASVMSWEEVTADKEGNDKAAASRNRSYSIQTDLTFLAQPWGKVCTGSYSRALERFNGKSKDYKPKDRPRRKSSPVIKPMA